MPKPALAAAALALAALGANAQTQAPGLWEHEFSLTSSGGELEKAQAQLREQLAAMSPEKRKQVEDMMASRGIKLSGQGASAKVCVTPEQAARPVEPPRMQGDCKGSDVQRHGNTMSFKFSCTTPQPISGEGEVTYSSDKSYAGHSVATAQLHGQPQRIEMRMSGKWLGAACGNVKPLGAPVSQ